MSRIADIDSASDRLDAALREAGLAPLEPARDAAVVDEIAEAIVPYELPPDVARFWQRFSVENERFPVWGWRMGWLTAPSSALEVYRLNLGPDFAMVFGPPLLFPIARHSETQWSVELRTEWGAGGAVFSHDADMRVEYGSFAEMIDVYAELVEEREFERGHDGRAILSLDGERRKQRERSSAAALRPLYGNELRVSVDPVGWPAHWLASAGIDPASRVPLGRTHTIAELVSAAEKSPAAGRIHGEIVRLIGIGSDCLALVDDGTRQLDVWCPAGTSPWGPVHRRRFELEVTIEHPVPPPPDLDSEHAEVVRQALAGQLEEAQGAAGAFSASLAQRPPSAVATDLRPLGEFGVS